MNISLSRYRKMVDSHFPFGGQAYRILRDWLFSNQRRPTAYGFTLAGCPVMTKPDWEADEIKTFLQLLNEHDIVVDVGANVGLYSCLAATRNKYVVCFEPAHRNLKFLYSNLWENRCTDVEVIPAGVSSSCGLAQMRGFGGMASFFEGWAQTDGRNGQLAPVTTLDTVFAGRFAGSRLLIKVDVEGYEFEVLRGAISTLAREPRPTWLIEILLRDSLFPDGVNHHFAEVFECFWKYDYSCVTLEAQPEVVTPEVVSRWLGNGLQVPTTNFMFRASTLGTFQ